MKFILIILFSTFTILVNSQNKIIEGNNTTASFKKSIDAFDALYVDLFCDIIVKSGSMPMIEILGDKNVIGKISYAVNRNEMRLETKEGYWLQSTRPKIILQTPYINRITSKGHKTNIGNMTIEGIDVSQFEVDLLYGSVKLEGSTDKLIINSSNESYYKNRSYLDASELVSNEVIAKFGGSNSAIVNVVEKLSVSLKHDARLSYKEEPAEIIFRDNAVLVEPGEVGVISNVDEQDLGNIKPEEIELQYVEVRVKNNSVGRKHFFIKGPNSSGSQFSYGFPMNPFAVRKKKVPVGTKIYLQKGGLFKKKLITITAKDDGKLVQLFSK